MELRDALERMPNVRRDLGRPDAPEGIEEEWKEYKRFMWRPSPGGPLVVFYEPVAESVPEALELLDELYAAAKSWRVAWRCSCRPFDVEFPVSGIVYDSEHFELRRELEERHLLPPCGHARRATASALKELTLKVFEFCCSRGWEFVNPYEVVPKKRRGPWIQRRRVERLPEGEHWVFDVLSKSPPEVEARKVFELSPDEPPEPRYAGLVWWEGEWLVGGAVARGRRLSYTVGLLAHQHFHADEYVRRWSRRGWRGFENYAVIRKVELDEGPWWVELDDIEFVRRLTAPWKYVFKMSDEEIYEFLVKNKEAFGVDEKAVREALGL